MTFSWEQCKKDAIDRAILREKILALKSNPDFVIKHADEASDAKNNNYTVLLIRVKQEMKKKQKLAIDRRAKRIVQ